MKTNIIYPGPIQEFFGVLASDPKLASSHIESLINESVQYMSLPVSSPMYLKLDINHTKREIVLDFVDEGEYKVLNDNIDW